MRISPSDTRYVPVSSSYTSQGMSPPMVQRYSWRTGSFQEASITVILAMKPRSSLTVPVHTSFLSTMYSPKPSSMQMRVILMYEYSSSPYQSPYST